jgi:cell division transport system permease protein
MIGGLGYFVSEAWLSLWRGRGASVLSVLTIAIAAFVLGLALLVGSHVQRTIDRWSRSAEVSVFLQDDATGEQRAVIERALRADKLVTGIDVVSKQQALASFRRDFPELAPATTLAPDNPFPASFEARLGRAPASGAALERLAVRVAALPGVADVRYDRRWLDRLVSVGEFVRWAGLGLAAVLFLAAALTITNVVRLSLHARRDEIEIMELVGAPLAFIRGPFVCEGMIQGGLGAVLALVALRAGLALAAPRISAMAAGLFEMGRIEFLSLATVTWLVAGAMAVGCLGGLFASRHVSPIGTNSKI